MERIEFPKEIMIEATNNCNNKCFFCASPVSDRKRGFIDPDLATSLIKQSYDLGCRKISFHGMGEPFLHKKLGQFIGTAKQKGFEYIYLDTNGTIAGKGVVEEVLDNGLDSLKFSIHAATPETFKRITGNDRFAELVQNAKYIKSYIGEHGLNCKTIAYFALSKINENEKEMFTDMMSEIFDEVWVRPIHNGSGVRMENDVFSVEKESFVASYSYPCRELYDRVIINWEGKAIACSTDWTGSLIYGDAAIEPLEVLWNSEKMQDLRKAHQHKDTLPRICSNCMGYKEVEE